MEAKSDSASKGQSSQLYECKYCKEQFHPLLAHDLHTLSKHATEWASTPFYPSSGVFSLATNDLLKIAQREFGSLRSVNIDDVRKTGTIFKWTPPKTTSTVAAGREKMAEMKNRKRRTDENEGNDSGIGGRESRSSDASVDGSKRPRFSSTSTLASSGPDLQEPATRTSSIESEEPKAPAWSRPRNITTFVAKNVSVSRRNRLALAGKPYYLQRSSRNDQHQSRDRQPSGHATAEASREVHAFRCYPKNCAGTGRDENKRGALYVFQPSDAADLLRSLTWKTTKALRQRQESKSDGGKAAEKSPGANKGQSPRFRNHRHSLSRRNRHYSDGNDDRGYSYEMESYRSQASYNQRIRRGRIYDARLDRVQADNATSCEIKNALHLYLFQSPAGERAATSDEIPFGRRDIRGQAALSGQKSAYK